MLENIKNKWYGLHPLFKVFITVWAGCMSAIIFSVLVSRLEMSDVQKVQVIECRYLETIKNIGFPDKHANLTYFDMQKFIGGKRILLNKFQYSLSYDAVLQYYDSILTQNGWQKSKDVVGELCYTKDGMEYLIKFLPNNIYEVKLYMVEQK